MTLDSITNYFKDKLNGFLHSDWLGTFIVIVVILAITALLTHLLTLFLKRILQSERGPLPSASIFINIGRVTMWCIGISVVLSSCFNINIGGLITALGIGGIAISLGFQSTLSNIIGGLQIILAGIVEPGDHIKVDGYEGRVRDVTWRHTTITTARGETVLVPNSLINTQSLVKLPPEKYIRINIVITEHSEPLDTLVPRLEKEIDAAVEKVTALEKKTKIEVVEKTEFGYRALVTLVSSEGVKKATIIDTALKAISDDAHKVGGPTTVPSNDYVYIRESKEHRKEEREQEKRKKREKREKSVKDTKSAKGVENASGGQQS